LRYPRLPFYSFLGFLVLVLVLVLGLGALGVIAGRNEAVEALGTLACCLLLLLTADLNYAAKKGTDPAR
jgi:hypothetical protein